jgi:hypothetical protein
MTGVVIILVICVLIAVTTQYFFWRGRIKQINNLEGDWIKFQSAARRNDIVGLNTYGEKLIWNKYVNQKQINFINEVLSRQVEKYPQLLKLYGFSKSRHEY